MLTVKWTWCGEVPCPTDVQGAKDLQKNVGRLWNHIVILESQIKKMNKAFCGEE